MSADTVHASVEKAMRRSPAIYDFSQWVKICEKAGNFFNVAPLDLMTSMNFLISAANVGEKANLLPIQMTFAWWNFKKVHEKCILPPHMIGNWNLLIS